MADRRFSRTGNENDLFDGGRHRQLSIQLCRLENHNCSCRNSGNANLDEMDNKFDKSSTSAYKDEFQAGNDVTSSNMKLQQHYCCDQCTKVYDTTKELNLHKEMHKKKIGKSAGAEKRNIAPTNSKSFTAAGCLKSRGKSLICPLCTKVVQGGQFNLADHIRTHTREKPYVCQVCNQGFACATSLGKHKRVHSGEKPYICQICSKGFKQLGSLKIHERVHTGEKPFVCPGCSQGFADKTNLEVHKRVHTGEKPYSCLMCSKQFTQKGNLQRHVRVHTRETMSMPLV